MRKKSKRTSLSKKFRNINLELPFHPFLFAVYPILFIYSSNLEEVFFLEIIQPIFISLAITTFIFFTLKFIFKDIHKAALLTTTALIIFFSYGHIFEIIEGFKILGFQIGRNKFLLPFTFSLSAIIFITILRSRSNFNKLSRFLNTTPIVLILLSLITISSFGFVNGLKITEREAKIQRTETGVATGDLRKLPDIYYIILDGYARASTLKKVYNFDNSEFINYLKDKGFYVANKSQSNYSLTHLSLASSLNMRHLIDIGEKATGDPKKLEITAEIIRNNEVAKILKSKGYTSINVGTGWGTTSNNPYADFVFHHRGRSEFIKILFQTSLLVIAEPVQTGDADSILSAFEKLAEIPDIQDPTFTLVHIVSPHPPYLFDRNGNRREVYFQRLGKLDSWRQKDKYIDQLVFINKKTKDVVENLLAKSKVPPIIIIQGDHGTDLNTDLDKVTKEDFDERMDILNAYYLPKGGNKTLYETITPINSFRKVLNYYFETDYTYLEDISYYSVYGKDFEFLIAPREKD